MGVEHLLLLLKLEAICDPVRCPDAILALSLLFRQLYLKLEPGWHCDHIRT